MPGRPGQENRRRGWLARGRVPDLDQAVHTGRDHPVTRRVEIGVVDGALVKEGRTDGLTAHGIPEGGAAVVTGGDNPTPVWAEGCIPNRTAVA